MFANFTPKNFEYLGTDQRGDLMFSFDGRRIGVTVYIDAAKAIERLQSDIESEREFAQQIGAWRSFGDVTLADDCELAAEIMRNPSRYENEAYFETHRT